MLFAVAASLLVWSARWWWAGELAASFAWYLGLATLLGALLLVVLRSWISAGLAIVLGLLHAGPGLWLYVPEGGASVERAAGERGFAVASCNLLWTNTRYAAFARWLEDNDPDVVICLELSLGWRALVTKLPDYPHVLLSPEPQTWNAGTWGAGILSRYPFDETRLIPEVEACLRPTLEARVRWRGESILVRGVHTPRPGRAWRIQNRNEVLQQLMDEEWQANAILAGDLNLAGTSPVFADLLQATGLHDSRRGFGRQPTWTSGWPIAGLSVAIDHVLVGDAWRVVERRVSEIRGSDHLAVFARLLPAK